MSCVVVAAAATLPHPENTTTTAHPCKCPAWNCRRPRDWVLTSTSDSTTAVISSGMALTIASINSPACTAVHRRQPSSRIVQCLHQDGEVLIARLAVCNADTDHIALLEARDRYPRAAGGEHPGDYGPGIPERCGRHGIEQRKRRVIDYAPAAPLELFADPRGLRDRSFDVRGVARPARGRERQEQPQPEEAARPLDGIHVGIARLLVRGHVARRDLKSDRERRRVTHQEHAAAHGGREPLVGIDGGGVRA